MGSLLSNIFGTAVTVIVPAVVWITLVAGFCQLIRDGIRRTRVPSQAITVDAKPGALAKA